MRILALLLLLSACASAQAVLTAEDEHQIRAVIKEFAANDNDSDHIWHVRGPLTYNVRTIEALVTDAATADAEGVRNGSRTERRQFTFILTRTNGKWNIAKRIQVCEGIAPVRIHPL
jgi:hypothetical protein